MTAERDNLLPLAATDLERAFVDVDGRLDDLDMAFVARVRDPAQAPAAYLPYLAWERSVDVWDPAWPEDVQRAVVAAAPIVHRYKGTRHGVRTALDALGIAVSIVEWWQTAPKGTPYTFKVTAYARARIYDGDFIVDPRLLDVIFATLMRTKPLSRAFSLAVGAGFLSPLGLAAVGAATTQHRAGVHAANGIRAVQTLALAAIGTARTKHRAALTLSYAP